MCVCVCVHFKPFTRLTFAVDIVVPKKVVAIVTGDLVTNLHVSEDFDTRHVLASWYELSEGVRV